MGLGKGSSEYTAVYVPSCPVLVDKRPCTLLCQCAHYAREEDLLAHGGARRHQHTKTLHKLSPESGEDSVDMWGFVYA